MSGTAFLVIWASVATLGCLYLLFRNSIKKGMDQEVEEIKQEAKKGKEALKKLRSRV